MQTDTIGNGASEMYVPSDNAQDEHNWSLRRAKKTVSTNKMPTNDDVANPRKWLKVRNAIAYPLIDYGCPFFLGALACSAVAGVICAVIGSISVGLFVLLGAAGIGLLAYLTGCALEKKAD